MTANNQQDTFLFNTTPTSQNTIQTLMVEKERLIVPIIFIPGVMGSNLKEKTTKSVSAPIWRLDGKRSAIGWAAPGYGNAKARKLELDPEKTEVDDRGTVVDAAAKECSQIEDEYIREINGLNEGKTEEYLEAYNIKQQRILNAVQNNPENKRFGTRRERGWGTVGYISYGEFLETFQENLFEPKGLSSAFNKLLQEPLFTLDEGSKKSLISEDEQIKHCTNFYFPVHAMGYNWLESNANSAKQLKILVEETLPAYYKKRGQTCDKVILVTHSMGGLVARYYTQALGGAEKVYGVINGVQPSTGAVAAYTRMKRGTEVNSTFLSKIPDLVMENVLGKNAAEMTAVCAQSPGPLQLLPTPEYGMGWLTITDPDGNVESYPKSEPYEEIYLAKDKWWCVCEPHLINPLNTDHNLQQMQDDWKKYENIILKKVILFNSAIANKFHPNTYVFFGIEDNEKNIRTEFLTYKSAHWKGRFVQGYQASMREPATDHIGEKTRLDLTELTFFRTIKARRNVWVSADVKSHYGTHPAKRGNINETYHLQSADGNGDGTVPLCSAEIPITHLQARMHFPIGHEPAYKSPISQEFTLRAIVDIVQQVTVND